MHKINYRSTNQLGLDFSVKLQYQASNWLLITIAYHTKDNKYIYGITSQIDKNISFVSHKVEQKDTLDNLSLTYYGRPDYYWMIADFNNIQDPYEKLYGNYESLKIPTFTSIQYIN